MRYWVREIAGWMLLLLGVFFFYRSYVLLAGEDPYLLQAACMTLAGFALFRGGIHLLKMAVAAELALQAAKQMDRPSARRIAAPVPRPAFRPPPRQAS